MARVLIPVDGSKNALNAIRKVADHYRSDGRCEIHLVNVQSPLSRHIAGFLRRSDVASWHRDEGLKALRSAMQQLTARGIPFAHHVRVGERARAIAELADELKCDRIVMGTARKNSLTRLVQDSVTNSVLELTRVPVEVIAGRQSSPFERYGIPAGVGAVVAFLAVAVD